MKKKLLFVLSMVLVAVLSVIGTLAYLTSEDQDVNVMTMGNVKIEQLEYERVVDKNGTWVSTGETDKYGYTPDKLQEFTQAKPLYPAVFADGKIKYDDRVAGHQQSWAQIGASGSMQLFDDSVKNVQDKFVFVKNTGKSDAYVRTWVALEQGNIKGEEFENIIKINSDASATGVNEAGGNSHWYYDVYDTDVEIDGNKYVVIYYTYIGARGNNGVLKPGTISYPNLAQVYMKPEATNEDVEAIDGNKNGLYDILVLSQAVQTKGFSDARTALDTAFGTNHPWVNTKMSAPEVENGVMNLTGDIYVVDKSFYNEADNTTPLTINGNGKTVYSTVTSADKYNWTPEGNRTTMGNLFASSNGSNITVKDITFKGETQGIQSGYWIGDGLNFNTTFQNVDIIDLSVPSYATDERGNRILGTALLSYGNVVMDDVTITGTKQSNLDGNADVIYDYTMINGTASINNSKIGYMRVFRHVTDLKITGNTVIDCIEFSFVKSRTDKSSINIEIDDTVTIKKVVVYGQEMTFEEWLNS